MVPKVAGKGASFKGAGAYYLHDKKADTARRVAFTHTENLPTNDPEMALRHMAYTAMHQDEIKALAGVKATGRKSAQSVYTYSLSWAPDEQPTREEMIEAGRESLKALGLERHEVLMVAHNDEPHPHLHLIVEQGPPRYRHHGQLKQGLSDALALGRGLRAAARGNPLRSAGGKQRKAPQRAVRQIPGRRCRRDTPLAQNARGAGPYVRKAEAENLSAYHRGQRQALFDHAAQRIASVREEMRARNRPKWAELFRRQREEWNALNAAQASAWSRLRYFIKHRGHEAQAGRAPGEIVRESMRAVFGRDNPHGALSRKHRGERSELAGALSPLTRSAIRQIGNSYRREMEQLERIQHQETQALQERHSRESQERAQDIAQGRDVQQFRKEAGPTLSDEFERKAWEKIREAKQRREEEKKRGRDRDGGRERDE